MDSLLRSGVLFGILILLIFLDKVVLGTKIKEMKTSYVTNILTLLFNDIIVSICSISVLVTIADQYNSVGVFYGLNPFMGGLISLVVLDLVLYGWHYLCHTNNMLWELHKIHHSDHYMNPTTTFRLHLGEVIIIIALKALIVLITGINADVLLTSELLITFVAVLHHSNLKLPNEDLLGRIIVVPTLHRTHHSTVRTEHDSNYGAMFSIWDMIFQTKLSTVPVKLGLNNVDEQSFYELLKYGFFPPKSSKLPVVNPVYDLNLMIAEAAYYKALNRGFQSNHIDDWLEAEKEITAQFA